MATNNKKIIFWLNGMIKIENLHQSLQYVYFICKLEKELARQNHLYWAFNIIEFAAILQYFPLKIKIKKFKSPANCIIVII